MDFRHEWKHIISYSDLLVLRSRLAAVMQWDAHAVNGKYMVRSLYFDNLSDKALREKIDGVNPREKFRIRYYNDDTSFIILEKKSRVNGMCSKEQAELSLAEVQSVLDGNMHELAGSKKELLKELYLKMNLQGLRPKIIVDYIREPFVCGAGNVRVTLDYDIRVGMGCTDFLSTGCVTIPVCGTPVILEVKYDGFLPSVIRDIVQTAGTQTSAFSKYAACRMYG